MRFVSRGGTEPCRLQPRALNDFTTTLLHVAPRYFFNHYFLRSPGGREIPVRWGYDALDTVLRVTAIHDYKRTFGASR
jgi:hypothetical protein